MEHAPLLCPAGSAGIGPDVVLRRPATEILAASLGGSQPNPRVKTRQRGRLTMPADFATGGVMLVRTAVVRAAGWHRGAKGPTLDTPDQVAAVCAHMTRLDHERVVSLLLNRNGALIAIHEAAVGGMHGCALTPRDVYRMPLLVGASGFIMVHNHPSGDPAPSPEDVQMTDAVRRATDALGIRLVDHVVVARGGATSIGALLGWRTGLPGASYAMAADERLSRVWALDPWGALAPLVVRSAVIESEGTARPALSSFDAVTGHPLVRTLPIGALAALLLDGRNGLMAAHVSTGAPNARRIFAAASVVPTSALVVARARSGAPAVTTEDVVFAKALTSAADVLGVSVLDVVLVGAGPPISLLEAGILGA